MKEFVEQNGTYFSIFASQFPGRNQHQLKLHYLKISDKTKNKHIKENNSKFNALPRETKSDIYHSLIKEGSYTNFSKETVYQLNQSGISTTYLASIFCVNRLRLGEFLQGKDALTRRLGPTKAQEKLDEGYERNRKYFFKKFLQQCQQKNYGGSTQSNKIN